MSTPVEDVNDFRSIAAKFKAWWLGPAAGDGSTVDPGDGLGVIPTIRKMIEDFPGGVAKLADNNVLTGANTCTQPLTIVNGTADQHAVSKAQLETVQNIATTGRVADLASVKTASSTNINIAAPGATIGGYNPNNGEGVLLMGQNTQTENRVWVFNGAATPMTARADADSAAELGLANVEVDATASTFEGNRYQCPLTSAQITVGGGVGTCAIPPWTYTGKNSSAAAVAVEIATRAANDTAEMSARTSGDALGQALVADMPAATVRGHSSAFSRVSNDTGYWMSNAARAGSCVGHVVGTDIAAGKVLRGAVKLIQVPANCTSIELLIIDRATADAHANSYPSVANAGTVKDTVTITSGMFAALGIVPGSLSGPVSATYLFGTPVLAGAGRTIFSQDRYLDVNGNEVNGGHGRNTNIAGLSIDQKGYLLLNGVWAGASAALPCTLLEAVQFDPADVEGALSTWQYPAIASSGAGIYAKSLPFVPSGSYKTIYYTYTGKETSIRANFYLPSGGGQSNMFAVNYLNADKTVYIGGDAASAQLAGAVLQPNSPGLVITLPASLTPGCQIAVSGYIVGHPDPTIEVKSVVADASSQLRVTQPLKGVKILANGNSIPAGIVLPFGTYTDVFDKLMGSITKNLSLGSSVWRFGVHTRRKTDVPVDDPQYDAYGITGMGWDNALYSLTKLTSEWEDIRDHWESKWYALLADSSGPRPVSLTPTIIANAARSCIDVWMDGNLDHDILALHNNRNDGYDWTTDVPPEGSEYDRGWYIGAMRFALRRWYRLAGSNKKAFLVGPVDDDPIYPTNVAAMKYIADEWKIPYCPLHDLLGWTRKSVLSTAGWVNQILVEGAVAAREISVLALKLFDLVHPHSDFSGRAILQIGQTLAAWAQTYVRPPSSN